MIQLPANWLKRVQVKEFPENPFMAVLILSFKNDYGQVFNWYQVVEGKHGVHASTKLEEGLKMLQRIDFEHEQPYTTGSVQQKSEAIDQNWEQIMHPTCLNLKDYRTKHDLKDPEASRV